LAVSVRRGSKERVFRIVPPGRYDIFSFAHHGKGRAHFTVLEL
jgi:hypothetical protein